MIVNDSCMQVLKPKLEELAAHLKSAADEGKYFAIRYHNDCDGICAGLCVFRALKAIDADCAIQSFPSQKAVYELRDAFDELSNLNDSKETILILVDHGANPESIAALKMLKASGVEIIILDHHPHDKLAERIASYFISPLIAGGNSSHTAGLLCYELAKLIDENCIDAKIAHFSLQADKSEFALKDKQFREPVAIDYISTFEELDLPFYDSALDNKELIDEAYLQAMEKIGNAVKQSKLYTDQKDYDGYSIITVKISKFLKKGEYPPRGKVMNEIIALKERELDKPLVCLGVIDDSISFRANKRMLDLGFDANELIKQLKKTFGNEIYNGGGHSAASALQASSDAIPAILREISELISQQVKKD